MIRKCQKKMKLPYFILKSELYITIKQLASILPVKFQIKIFEERKNEI